MRVRRLHCEAKKGVKYWVAQCLENSLTVQGRTIEEARENLNEALQVYYRTVTEMKAKGERVSHLRPVPFYRLRLARWYLRWWLSSGPSHRRSSFTLDRSMMPIAASHG